MRVVVEFDDDVHDRMADWRRGLSPNPLDRRLLAQTYIDVFCQRMIDTGGFPADALVTGDPPTHWYPLAGATWLGYRVATRGTIFRRERVVTVSEVRLGSGPPHPARPAAPLS